MSVAQRGVDPDPVPDRDEDWEAARAHLKKIWSKLPQWAQKKISLDMDGDDDDVTVYVSLGSFKLDDFNEEVESQIYVLNQAMVKS